MIALRRAPRSASSDVDFWTFANTKGNQLSADAG